MDTRRITSGLCGLAFAVGIIFSVHAKEEKDETVSFSQLPEAVQKTVKEHATETEIKKIEKGDENGKAVFEVEFVKGGKNCEVVVLPDGKLLSMEEEIALADAPEPVQKSINEQAKGGKVLAVEKITADGKTVFEATIQKGKKKTEVTVAPDGKVDGSEDVAK